MGDSPLQRPTAEHLGEAEQNLGERAAHQGRLVVMDIRLLNFKIVEGLLAEARFSDGQTRQIDFAPLTAEGEPMAALSDAAVLSQFAVRQEGQAVSWPGGLELTAAALYELGTVSGRTAGIPGARSGRGPTGTLRKHGRSVSKAR